MLRYSTSVQNYNYNYLGKIRDFGIFYIFYYLSGGYYRKHA